MKVYLNKLELHGFKSFPEKTVIKFHKGITTIIGPNGCGKSNIVDALLWVLGEQRIKNLRGENNEDLIFSGSVSKKPLGMTEVGAYFSNVPEDTYLARRFYRNGEGKYILNEKYCRNRDIQDMLYKLNLGGRNYFIFEQGSIEKLVSLKPSERRLLIEEAAGISQYLLRKKETANKLIIAQQNLDNLEILTIDKERRLKELKNQTNYVARYRNIKEDSLKYIRASLLKKYHVFKSSFDENSSIIERRINEEMALVKDISINEKELSSLEAEKWRIEQNLKNSQRELFELKRSIVSEKGKNEKLSQERGFLKQKVDEDENSLKEIDNDLKKELNTLSDLEKKYLNAVSEFKKAEGMFSDAKTDVSENREREHSLNVSKKEHSDKLDNFKTALSLTEAGIIEIEKTIFRLENDIETWKESKKALENEIDETAIKNEEVHLAEIEKDFEIINFEFSKSEEKLINLKNLLSEKKFEINELTSELNFLVKQNEKYRELKNQINVKISENEKNSFKLIQDIIKTEKKNNKIIENFFHDELKSVISESIEKAFDKDIESFFISGGKRSLLPKEVEKEEGFIGYIKDLFSLENKEIMNSLKDGILVSGLEEGIKIYKKYRIPAVTQNAEFISESGVVFKKRNEGILDLINEIDLVDQRMKEIDKLLSQKKRECEDLNKEINKSSIAHGKLNTKKEDLGRQVFQSKLTLKNLTGLKESKGKKLDSLINSINENKKKLREAEERSSALKNKKSELLEKDKKNSISLDSLDKELSELRKKNASTEESYWKAENALNLEKEKKNSLQNEKTRIQTDITRMKERKKYLEDEIKKAKSRISGIIKEDLSLNKEIKNIKNKSEEKEQYISDKEKEQININEKVKKLSEQLGNQRKLLNELKEKKSISEIELSGLKKDIFTLEEESFKELNVELAKVEADEELMKLESSELEQNAGDLKEKLDKMRESNKLNFSAESEYALLEKDYGTLITQKDDVVESIKDMTLAINKIDTESKESFMAAFNIINENFKKNFQILFEGGEAELSLTDESDILETGLEIMAQPPGKRLQSLRLLSGGEKTLTSLAFLFALFEYKPSPFCVFDEVDASLDEANIQRFLKFVHKLKEKIQFLIITHNFKTMEEADYIYGISMNEPGISTIYSMKMNPENGFPLR